MVMLSSLLRFRAVTTEGVSGNLRDLAVDLSVGDYPVVRAVLVAPPHGDPVALPWEAVEHLSETRRELRLNRPPARADAVSLDHLVCLEADVLDALVLDLEHQQATRANDLWLEQEASAFWLRAADLSPWGVIRRLGRGLLGNGAGRDLLDWRQVEFLRGEVDAARGGRDYHRRVARLSPPEIARLAESVPYLHAAELLSLIPEQLAADAFEAMTSVRQLQIFEELDDDRAAGLLALIAPDAAADLLGQLEPAQARRFLDLVPARPREQAIELLRYPDQTAGGIMTNELIVLVADETVAAARERLVRQLARPDFVYYAYVVEDLAGNRLLGVLTLRDFILADPERLVSDVMNPHVRSIDPSDSAVAAARQVAENGFAALPVVAPNGRLVGAVTVDAAFDRLAPPSWRGQTSRIFS